MFRQKTLETTRQMENSEDRNDSVNVNTKCNIYILTSLNGAIELNILCHFPLLDPVAKATLKRTYLDDDIADVHKLSVAYETLAVVSNYSLLADEIRHELTQHGGELQEKRNQMSVKVPLRPEECLYEALKRDVSHFMSTCAQPVVLRRMIESFEEQFQHQLQYSDLGTNRRDAEQFLAKTNDLIKRTELWLNNVDKFEHHTLPTYRVYYRDFVEPLCCSLAQLRHGCTNLLGELVGRRDSIVKLDNGFYVDVNGSRVRLTAFLTSLIEFPTNFETVARDLVPGYKATATAEHRISVETTKERTNIYPLLERLPNGNVLLFKYVFCR